MAKPADLDLICIGCGKSPGQLAEYVDAAAEAGMSPDSYVWREEGTLNVANGHFACTLCYLDMGMPVGESGQRWVAP